MIADGDRLAPILTLDHQQTAASALPHDRGVHVDDAGGGFIHQLWGANQGGIDGFARSSVDGRSAACTSVVRSPWVAMAASFAPPAAAAKRTAATTARGGPDRVRAGRKGKCALSAGRVIGIGTPARGDGANGPCGAGTP